MNISKILKEFVKECSEKLNLMAIIQFGSSTHSKNPDDYDLVFFSKDLVFSSEDHEKLFLITTKFEKKYKDLSFDMSTPLATGKKYKITIVPLQNADLIYLKNADKFFFRFLQKDEHRKVLYGKDPLVKLNLKITKENIIGRLLFENNKYVRLKIEKVSLKNVSEFVIYYLKTVLILMLTNEQVYKKSELMGNFIRSYKTIKIPKNWKDILDHKVTKGDYEEVLKFSEDCIRYLAK